MPLPICSQVSGVSCLLAIPETHECASVAYEGASEFAVTRLRLSTIIALSVASIAMPMKALA